MLSLGWSVAAAQSPAWVTCQGCRGRVSGCRVLGQWGAVWWGLTVLAEVELVASLAGCPAVCPHLASRSWLEGLGLGGMGEALEVGPARSPVSSVSEQGSDEGSDEARTGTHQRVLVWLWQGASLGSALPRRDAACHARPQR